jgi:ADP-ribosylglycohydrolase
MQAKNSSAHDNDNVKGIIGAVIGDIIGSMYEFPKGRNIPKKLKWFSASDSVTDDSVLTVAVADALLHNIPFEQAFRTWGNQYPAAGFGRNFRRWLKRDPKARTNSAANGCAMRISSVGFYAKDLNEALELAKEATVPTHNCREGIRSAQAIAAAIFLAREGKSKQEIKQYVENTFHITVFDNLKKLEFFAAIHRLLDYVMAKSSVSIALSAFMLGNNFEEVINTSIKFGVDTDTIAAIAGGVAAAYYGVPRTIAEQATRYIPKRMLDIINEFDGADLPNLRITPPVVRRWGNDYVVVYGTNAAETEGERGFFETRASGKNRNPLAGFPIHTIGTSIDTVKRDIQHLVAEVEANPDKIFLIEDVGIGKKSQIGLDVMAPLFEPLKDKENVYLHKDIWNRIHSNN